MRICILSRDNVPLGFMDNDVPNALHFYDDKLHVFMKGSAHTFEFSAVADHEDACLLEVGNKLSFYYKNTPYYLNIMVTEQTETEIKVEAWAYALELLNETAMAYSAQNAMTFVQYIRKMNFEFHILEIGINEVANKSITNEWTNENDTILKRLYSLATLFDAEIEFIPRLNDDYSLNKIVLNVYRAHSSNHQGIGQKRDDMRYRYGKDVTGIIKKQDISELYTCIRPYGNDDLTIKSIGKREHKDPDGNVAYTHAPNAGEIMAPIAAQNFPSTVGVNDKYIAYNWKTDYKDAETLYSNALAKLKEISVPKCTYEIKGYIDVNIGDTITVVDESFNPPLYLETRVTEQELSITDSTKNSTTFDNTTELESQLDDTLLKRLEELKQAADAAKEKAESAAETANVASTKAATALSTAQNASDTATEASTKADNANTAAANAQSTADSAADSASNATAIVATVNENLQEVQRDLSDNMEQINNDISNTQNSIETLRSDTQNLLTQLREDAESSLQAYKDSVAKYIRFSDDSGLILGATDSSGTTESPFRTIIDNTSLKFQQDGYTVAEINNQRLDIAAASIRDLDIGNFDFHTRADGGLSITWRGGV